LENSLHGNAIKEDFISTNKDVFDALAETRDFSDKGVVDEIMIGSARLQKVK